MTPAAPAKLMVATEPPGSLTAGAGFGLTVDVDDPYGNLTAFSGDVGLSIATGPGGATLGGQTMTTASGGVVTFAGLMLTRSGSYKLQASGSGLPPVTINPITVSPRRPANFL